MSFYVSHRMGGDDDEPPLESLDALLDEVHDDPSDREHFSVSVVHENDWGVSVSAGYRLVLEHLEDETIQPRHLDGGPHLRALAHARDGGRRPRDARGAVVAPGLPRLRARRTGPSGSGATG